MTKKIPGAVGLVWRRRASGRSACYWAARPDLIKRGWTPRTQLLWMGSGEPGDAECRRIADGSRRLQDEMLAWANGQPGIGRAGTLARLIQVYQTDPDSPYRDLRPHTRRSYDHDLGIIERNVGDSELRAIGARDLMKWYRVWRRPAVKTVKQPDGSEREVTGPERIRRAHGLMAMIRMLVRFGAAWADEADRQPCATLAMMFEHTLEFEVSRPRGGELTADMANAVRAKAHEMGRPSVAMAQALQFELGLRQKDVIGEWVPMGDPGLSSVTDRGQKWVVGVRWDEIDRDLILAHPLSKSNGTKTGEYDLRLYPMIMDEMSRRERPASGPVIVSEATGRPYRTRHFADVWREVADAAGVPRTVWNMDSRAGATTEAVEATGGDLEAARKQAGHSHVATTARYSRGALRSNSAVAKARSAYRSKE